MDTSTNSKPSVSLYFVFNVGLGLITFNAYAAFISPGHDLWWTILFVIYASAFSVLLFLCLYLFDRSPENLENRERLKIIIWVMGAMLLFTSARWISMALIPIMAMLAWAFAGSTSLLSFYFFFINGDDSNGGNESGADEAFLVEEV